MSEWPIKSDLKLEIYSVLEAVQVAAVATSAGRDVRNRMMHFVVDSDLNVYLASMKGDAEALQMTCQQSVAILVYRNEGDINESGEVEIFGRTSIVRDEAEQQQALAAGARRSSVVGHLMETGNADALDWIKVVPETIKYRVFEEIVQGRPAAVLYFPENRVLKSDLAALWSKMRVWQMAARMPFLTASLVPIALGTAIAVSVSGLMHWDLFLLTVLAGVFIHTGTNIINDYFDHRSGNDDINREFVRPFSGGSRVIQLGLLSPVEVLGGALFCIIIASLIGVYLALVRGPMVFVLGIIGVISGVFYTGKPLDFASRGLGELLIALNFGLLMTLGAYYVQTQTLSWVPVVAAVPVALLIGAVLYVNELPDYNADRAVGKRTIVVRLGRERAPAVYSLTIAGSHLSVLVGVSTGILPVAALLTLLTLPLCVQAARYVRKHHSSPLDLIPANALTVLTHLVTGVLLTLAFVWEAIGTR